MFQWPATSGQISQEAMEVGLCESGGKKSHEGFCRCSWKRCWGLLAWPRAMQLPWKRMPLAQPGRPSACPEGARQLPLLGVHLESSMVGAQGISQDWKGTSSFFGAFVFL